MAELIRGKVARVFDNRSVAINRGTKHGVEKGMKFAIIDNDADEIKDPDTGERLGALARTKAFVQVTVAYDLYSIASTYRIVDFSSLFSGPGLGIDSKTPETFTYEGEATKRLSSAPVQVGDRVVQDIRA